MSPNPHGGPPGRNRPDEPEPEPSPHPEPEPEPEPKPEPDPEPSDFDVRLTGDDLTFASGFTVPAGKVWDFDPDVSTTVEVSGNVVVEGTLRMRPSSPDVTHTLRFTNVDEDTVVGGGMEILDTDVGLWVTGDGILDAVGTPREGWNRTGTSDTWLPGDDVFVAPIGDPRTDGDWKQFTFAPFTPGTPVPKVVAPDGRVHQAEVFNTTRNVVIESRDGGRAHTSFLMCRQPQTIKYVRFDNMGSTENELGRYALHFHHCQDGSRGTLIEGVVLTDTAGLNGALVTHASHGITVRDTFVHRSFDVGFGWDPPADRYDLSNDSHDILWDRCGIFGLFTNQKRRAVGFVFQTGERNEARGCVAVGVRNGDNAGGFHWGDKTNKHPNAIWIFSGNVAHNNNGPGIAVWQNTFGDHVIADSTSFFNRDTGVNHGAYRNAYTYTGVAAFGNGKWRNGQWVGFDLIQHALGKSGGIDFESCDFGSILIVRHNLPGQAPVIYRATTIRGRVVVSESRNGGEIMFVDCPGLTAADFVVESCLSDIMLVADGSETSIC